MSEEINKPKIKPAMIIAIVLIVFGLAAAAYFLASRDFKGDVREGTIAEDADSEARGIKEINRQAIDEAENQAVNLVRPIDATDHIRGNIDAPVQLIIYGDFECPFCAEFEDTMASVKSEFGEKVVISFRHYLLATHLSALPAALASECADEQGKFWEMHGKLYDLNINNRFIDSEFKAAAVELGLDKKKFTECLDTEKYKDKISGQMSEARDFNVTGTPTIFLNGRTIPGALPFDDFTDSSDRQRQGMKTLIEKALQ